MMVIKKSRDADKKNEPPAAVALVYVPFFFSFQLIIFGIYIYIRSVYLLLTLSTCKFFAGDPDTRKIRGTCSFFFLLRL